MKKSKFIINVGDLLLSAGKRDEISFENEMIESLDTLTKDGINGKVIIQSFDQNSLLVTLQDISCTLHETCDRCTEGYDREIFVPEYSAKFQIEIDPDYEGDDEVFLIDKNENIDIQDMILNAINLQEPFTKLCKNCQALLDEEDDEDEELSGFEGSGNISFR